MKQTKYSAFQKLMIIIVPIVVLLLITAIVMCAAFTFLPMRAGQIVDVGNITMIMGAIASALAIVSIVFSIIAKDNEEEEN